MIEMDEEIWVINKTDKKIKVSIKEIHFYYGDIAYQNEVVMEDIGRKGYERRIVVEITKVEDAKEGDA